MIPRGASEYKKSLRRRPVCGKIFPNISFNKTEVEHVKIL